ncbi:DUF4230 domain-containing protein [Nocardioides aequoreus]|uniref:DUF4230 domain-containing protein n=1 Tax=Nocardioides aequoreus TaxID=397278 RepID=UPI00068F9B23|nr:DUF4230 domain-containing protein [Nocardioides aequoreus]
MFIRLIGRLVTPLAILALGVAVLVAAKSLGIHIPDPLGHERVDNSQPPLLKSIQELSRYHAAQGNFEVVVDIEDDVKHVPDWLSGRRAVFVGTGSVDAYVDLANLSKGAVQVSADNTAVQITLPAPQLDAGDLDLDAGHFVIDDSGWLDRLTDYWFGDADQDFQLEVMRSAEQKISDAAEKAGLRERAEENTQSMLYGFLKALGYQTVTIAFANTEPDTSAASAAAEVG